MKKWTRCTGFASLLVILIGCSSGNTVELPTNPTPKPKDPFFQEQGAGGGQIAPKPTMHQQQPRS